MATQKRTLAELKAAHCGTTTNNQPQQFTNNYYPFWNMEIGQRAVIRFLPDLNQNNARGFSVERVYHELTINGQKKKIPCLAAFGEECPICKISQAYYKAKDELNGKKYYKKRQYLCQALIIEDPLPANAETGETYAGKVGMIALGFQIYTIIKEAFASDELEGIPYDFEEGYDFIIKKTEQGKYGTYAVGTKFMNKQRPLTAAELAIVEENMIDLSTLLPKSIGLVKVQAMLDAEMNGEEYNDGSQSSNSNDDDEEDYKPVTTKASAPAKAPIAPTVEADEEGESNGDVDAMLAKIQARRAKASGSV